jgi:hypothetical protein
MDGVVGLLQRFGGKGVSRGKDVVAKQGKACTGKAACMGFLGLATTFLVGTQVSGVLKGDDKGRVGNETL